MDKKLDSQTGEAEEQEEPFKISDLWSDTWKYGFLVGIFALCTLLFCNLPIPEVCSKYVAV